jgi:plastocyanin
MRASLDRKGDDMKRAVASLAACGLLVTAAPAFSAPPTVRGTVGPGDTIGLAAKPKRPGTYRLVVRDLADEHNFRLRGPGVNVATTVGGTGTRTFTVRLKPGRTYTFVCDPHADEMRGSFTVRG